MAEWIISAAARAENLLNNIDQAAAETLADASPAGGGHRSRGGVRSTRSTRREDSTRTGRDSSADGGSSHAYPRDVGRDSSRDQRSNRNDQGSFGSKTSPSAQRTRLNHQGGRTKQDITSDQLFDFLNETSSSSKKSSSSGKGRRHHSGSSVSSGSNSSGGDDHIRGENLQKKTAEPLPDAHLTGGVPSSIAAADNAIGLGRDDSTSILDGADDDPAALTAICQQLESENKLLRREVTALSDEVSTFATRVRSTQDALADSNAALAEAERKVSKAHAAKRDFINTEQQLEAELADRDSEIEVLRKKQEELKADIQRLVNEKENILKDHSDSTEAHSTSLETIRTELETLRSAKEEKKDELEASKHEATVKIHELESAGQKLQANLDDANAVLAEREATIRSQATELSTKSNELASTHRELEDYKTRASRILQMKEKTIEDLRIAAGGDVGAVGSSTVEAIELKRERDALSDEVKDLNETIRQLRIELQEIDKQHRDENDLADRQLKDLETAVKDLQKSKIAAEREHTLHVQDLKLSVEELQRFKQSAGQESMRKEAEIAKLQNEINRVSKSISGTATSQLELKIRSLTDNVLGKQSQIEALAAEKQSLSLQLEHERRKPADVRVEMPTRNQSRASLRDDDGSRLQSLSTIIGDSSYDADLGPGLRRMKHAVHALDKLSIQLGIFLRRYPAARLMVMLYIVLLHLWVMVVIMTYSPEMHGTHSEVHGPVHPDHVGVMTDDVVWVK